MRTNVIQSITKFLEQKVHMVHKIICYFQIPVLIYVLARPFLRGFIPLDCSKIPLDNCKKCLTKG